MERSGFQGERVSRDYYWAYFSTLIFVSLFVGFFEGLFVPSGTSQEIFNVSWRLGTSVLWIIMTIPRLHDIDKSGWFILVPIYNWIAPLFFKGNLASNIYGQPPLNLQERQYKIVKRFFTVAVVIQVLLILFIFVAIFTGVNMRS